MNILTTKVWAIGLIALIAGAVRADDVAGLQSLALIAKLNQSCEDFKKDKAKIEQAQQSRTLSREQKEQAARAATELDKVITATETLLKDPALKTSPETREAILAKAQSAIVYGNVLASTTERRLGIPRPGMTDSVMDRVIAARTNIEGLLTQGSRFDGSPAANWTNGDERFKGSGVGSALFGPGRNTSEPVSVNATYTRTTPESAKQNVDKYGSAGGGILEEDSARGLGPISTVKFDGRYNALVMDDHLVYFIKVPSFDAAALCRNIARDKDKDGKEMMRVGVSIAMGGKNLVYGERSTYENTAVAHNLLLTDQFLGDFVFAHQKWTKGYNFSNGYKPQTAVVTAAMLVQFVFRNFQFTAKDNEIQLANLALDVRFMPVSKEPAPDGGLLPDYDALKGNYEPPAGFLANAQYLTSHFDFFRRERIVAEMIAYGELAALFRSYKQAGVNLEALASELERG